MSALVAFYAPLKAPDYPIPSGDRRMARTLVATLGRAGYAVEVASRLRSYDRAGDPARQERIAALGARLAERLVRRYRARPPQARPGAWLTYHVYHKSPDWLGPEVSRALQIPYLVVEASFAPKQAHGPWGLGLAASARAIRQADVVLAMTGQDAQGLQALVHPPAELRRLPPFLDPAPFAAARARREEHRSALARRFGLDPAQPWLLVAAMMRADVKLQSYRLLASALQRLQGERWQLLVVGDGPARGEVERAFARLGLGRVVFAGALDEAALPPCYAACDLCAWPAVREAYGLAMLEAAAAGLPVVAGAEGGVAEVVQDGVTGRLTPPRDVGAFAAAVADLLAHPDRRSVMGRNARAFVARERGPEAAAAALASALEAAREIRARRR